LAPAGDGDDNSSGSNSGPGSAATLALASRSPNARVPSAPPSPPAAELVRADEQRLLRCVALALSHDRGPPPALLAATRADLLAAGGSFAVAERLLCTLERMGTCDRLAALGGSSSSSSSSSSSHVSSRGCGGGSSSGHGGGHGRRAKSRHLPRVGFECLAALCDSALVAASQRGRWAFPFALLRAAAAFHQDLAADPHAAPDRGSDGSGSSSSSGNGSNGSSSGSGLLESLGSRVSEHRVFVDPKLWEAALTQQLRSFAGGSGGSGATTTATAATAPPEHSLLLPPPPLAGGADATAPEEPFAEPMPTDAAATDAAGREASSAGAVDAEPRAVVQQLTSLI
jgi:hypothetical protein